MLKNIYFKLFSLFLMMLTPAVYAGGPEYGFNQVQVDGYVNVIIRHAAQTHVNVSTKADQPVVTHMQQGTLYIQAPWSPLPGVQPHRPAVTVYLPNLTRLVVNGPANVAGVQLATHGLTLIANGTGKIKLIGMMDVNRIEQNGHNRIYLRWLDSNTLSINSHGNGLIYLGGIAKVVYARIHDQAVLNAQYLRADTVQVQVKDAAAAYVYPVNNLRAFASDHANIYYYKYPVHLTRYTTQSGNVLQMAWRP